MEIGTLSRWYSTHLMGKYLPVECTLPWISYHTPGLALTTEIYILPGRMLLLLLTAIQLLAYNRIFK